MFKVRSGCLRWVLLIALGVAAFYLFQFEAQFLKNLLVLLINGSSGQVLPPTKMVIDLLAFLVLNFLGIIFIVFLLFYWIAITGFPLKNNRQAVHLIGEIVRSMFGQRTALLRTREGSVLGEIGEQAGNALLIDLESAAVVESGRLLPEKQKKSTDAVQVPGFPLNRVVGPGLEFLKSHEKCRDVVSLRRQIRTLSGVRGQTREGIELETDTTVIFSLSGQPRVIHAAYDGKLEIENLRLIQIDPQIRRIRAIINDLDEPERMEIHRYAQSFLAFMRESSPLVLDQETPLKPPYWFAEDRILAGVYSRARNVSAEKSPTHWTDLPAMVAAEAFRNLISQYSLDELYLPEEPLLFPLQSNINPKFAHRVCRQGVMLFQFIHRTDGELPDLAQRVDHRNFHISPVQELRSSRVLRGRGISVVNASFSDPAPTDPQIDEQRLNNWRERWQREADKVQTNYWQEVERIKKQARLNRQQEILTHLREIIRETAFSEEESIGLIFQKLDEIASDTLSKGMISPEILEGIHAFKRWLLSDKSIGSNVGDSYPEEEP